MTPDACVLGALRAAAAPLSIPELARQARLSPEMLEKRIAELRIAGYEIELQPHLGYRLLAAPDRLIADDLMAMLGQDDAPLPLPLSVLVFAETSSTNDVAARLGRSGAAAGTVVFAESQTAGRGRLGRRWESAAHQGLWFSLLLRPQLPVTEWTRLTTWAAVGVARGIETAVPGVRAGIKWPNDIYLSGRKAVGILIESSLGGAAAERFAVVGIGVNINHRLSDFPPELEGKAISLREASGADSAPLDRQAVAVALLRSLSALYPSLGSALPAIVAEAQARSVLLGKRVEIQSVSGSVAGVAEALEADGALRVRRDDGETVTVSGGEAVPCL